MTWVQSMGQEGPLEEDVASHSSILAWGIPWTGETGGLQSTGSQNIRHSSSDLAQHSSPLKHPAKFRATTHTTSSHQRVFSQAITQDQLEEGVLGNERPGGKPCSPRSP